MKRYGTDLKKRSKFIEKLRKINPKKMIYVDETGFDLIFIENGPEH